MIRTMIFAISLCQCAYKSGSLKGQVSKLQLIAGFTELLQASVVIAGTGEPPDSGGHSESGVGSQL